MFLKIICLFMFHFYSRLIEEEGGHIAPRVEGRITIVGNL